MFTMMTMVRYYMYLNVKITVKTVIKITSTNARAIRWKYTHYCPHILRFIPNDNVYFCFVRAVFVMLIHVTHRDMLSYTA